MMSPAAQRKNVKKGQSGQNIKVFTRVRPTNNSEKANRSHTIVDCVNSREINVKERGVTKTFAFDRTFGADSKQIDVYKAVAKPLVEEVTNGFNCTIFAYGQTGTGKTFTMEGERSNEVMNWDEDPLAGIIPRSVNHLFDNLRIQKVEFTMKVSFLELYNEEIFDLLSAHDDLTKLRLYEDGSRKGSCIIQNLEEVLVRSKSDVYNVIAKGSAKRQTAATLMNAHSSRSHTVFTVTVHIKENTDEGDELLKTGKLHLVDLAGSENIGKSGAVDKRAREAGNINQSLLTLGRVITSLVEKAPHIPYRESKLTRLLQDALGGKTKTSIIATVSPASCNLDETLSTLDYAHRAKNIQNKPEVNQKLNKKELIGEYSIEIDKLRRDLLAMREKTGGVYLANDNYDEMVNTIEQQTQELSEKISQIRHLEEELEQKIEMFNATSLQLDKTCIQLTETENKLSETKDVLTSTQTLLSHTANERDEQKVLVGAHMTTEHKLHNEGKNLINVAEETTSDISKLQDKLDRKRNVEQVNEELSSHFREDFDNKSELMKANLVAYNDMKESAIKDITSSLSSTSDKCSNQLIKFTTNMEQLSDLFTSILQNLTDTHIEQVNDIEMEKNSFVSSSTDFSKEQLKKVTAFEKEKLIPFLTDLSLLISDQSESLSSLQLHVPENVDKMINECRTCCCKIDEVTGAIDDKLVEMNEAQMENDKKKRADIEVIKNSLQNALELVKRIDSMDDESKKMKADFTNYVNLRTNDIRDHTYNHSTINDKISGNIKATVDDGVSSLEKIQRKMGEQRCNIESSTSDHTNELMSQVKESLEKLDKYSNSTSERVIQSKDKCNALNQSKNEEVIGVVTKNKREVASSCNEWATEILEQVSNIENLSCDTNQVIMDTMEEVVKRNQDVQTLFTEEILHDQATGMTPVRRDYKFSKFLTATSPHERILNRIRNTSAYNTPLPSLTDDDDLHTLNSTTSSGQFSPDLCDKSEDLSPTSSESSINTRIPLSRSGSSDTRNCFILPSVPTKGEPSSRSVSRSSSTSSIPESKENSKRKGSFKKRELKTPTNYSQDHNKPRKILGETN